MNMLSPTDGQLALARQIADGAGRPNRGITHVPASRYTDPSWFAREKAALLKIWQLSAGALPPEYRDNSYLFSDVG